MTFHETHSKVESHILFLPSQTFMFAGSLARTIELQMSNLGRVANCSSVVTDFNDRRILNARK